MEDLSGKQLGQFQVIEPLGDGGMASVYKAYQASMERYVALKILPRHLAAEPDFVSRFKIESRVIANLEHPNILPVYDFGEAEGYTYLVMRFVENGQTLSSLLQGEPLAPHQIKPIINQIAAALDYAHSRDVVHRDIKPSNVLLGGHGNCLLSDFGLAKVLVSSSHLTASGAFLGTPKYASPEQCLGSSDIDQRSDVYSLGVILYEMVTGRPPFDADTPMGVVIKHIHDPLPLPSTINPDLPEPVERVILKALSKEAHGRYSTAGELAEAYDSAVAGRAEIPGGLSTGIGVRQPGTTPPDDTPGSPGKQTLGRPKRGLIVGLLVLMIIAFTIAGTVWGINRWTGLPATPTQEAGVLPTLEIIPTQTNTTPPPTPTALPSTTQTQAASATSLPTETPSPTDSFQSISFTIQESLVARSGPGTVYRWVEGSPYAAGTEVLIDGHSEDGAWFFIVLPGGLEAWVQVSDLQAEIDPARLPIIEAPPTPLPAATNTPKPAQSKDKDDSTGDTPAEPPPEEKPTNEPYP